MAQSSKLDLEMVKAAIEAHENGHENDLAPEKVLAPFFGDVPPELLGSLAMVMVTYLCATDETVAIAAIQTIYEEGPGMVATMRLRLLRKALGIGEDKPVRKRRYHDGK